MTRDDLSELARNGPEALRRFSLRDIDHAGGEAAAGSAFRLNDAPARMVEARIDAENADHRGLFRHAGEAAPEAGEAPAHAGKA